MQENSYFLHPFINCSSGGKLTEGGSARLQKASALKGDELHRQLSSTGCDKFTCHKNCASTYTSPHHINIKLRFHQMIQQPPRDGSNQKCLHLIFKSTASSVDCNA